MLNHRQSIVNSERILLERNPGNDKFFLTKDEIKSLATSYTALTEPLAPDYSEEPTQGRAFFY